jgi:hypothetical protein
MKKKYDNKFGTPETMGIGLQDKLYHWQKANDSPIGFGSLLLEEWASHSHWKKTHAGDMMWIDDVQVAPRKRITVNPCAMINLSHDKDKMYGMLIAAKDKAMRTKHDDIMDAFLHGFGRDAIHGYYGTTTGRMYSSNMGSIRRFMMYTSDVHMHAFDPQGNYHGLTIHDEIPAGWYALKDDQWYYRIIHRFYLRPSQVPAAYRLYLMVNDINQPET